MLWIILAWLDKELCHSNGTQHTTHERAWAHIALDKYAHLFKPTERRGTFALTLGQVCVGLSAPTMPWGLAGAALVAPGARCRCCRCSARLAWSQVSLRLPPSTVPGAHTPPLSTPPSTRGYSFYLVNVFETYDCI